MCDNCKCWVLTCISTLEYFNLLTCLILAFLLLLASDSGMLDNLNWTLVSFSFSAVSIPHVFILKNIFTLVATQYKVL